MQCTNLGGMEQSSLRLMVALKKRGHFVSCLSLNKIGRLGMLLEASEIPTVGLDYRGKFGWKSFPALFRNLRESQADAIILTGHNLGAILAVGWAKTKKRLLMMHYHHAGVLPRWQWSLLYGLAEKRFSAITFPSDFVREEANRIRPTLAPATLTIRNPIEEMVPVTREARSRARVQLGQNTTGLVIGNAGWLIPRKRFDIFLLTAREVLKQKPDWRFWIAGDGPERESLVSLARKLNIQKSVCFFGWVEDMKGFYSGIDLLLFNTDCDALPTTPQEAISMGIPVVASTLSGGLQEVIENGRNGHVIDTHDVVTLSKLVCETIEMGGTERFLDARRILLNNSNPNLIAQSIERLIEYK